MSTEAPTELVKPQPRHTGPATPPPWRVYNGKKPGTYNVVPNKKGHRRAIAFVFNQRDAQLIGAAPELLVVCKIARRYIAAKCGTENNEVFAMLETTITATEAPYPPDKEESPCPTP